MRKTLRRLKQRLKSLKKDPTSLAPPLPPVDGSNSPTPSISLVPPVNGTTRPISALGRIQSASPDPSLNSLGPLSTVHVRPASFVGQVTSSAATAGGAIARTPTASSAQPQNSISGSAKTPWEKAVARLKPDDLNQFNFTDPDKLSTLTEVLLAAETKRQECEAKQLKYRKDTGELVILQDIADNIFKSLNKLATVGDVVFQQGPQTLSMAWTPIRTLLQIATNDVETMANILSGLEHVARILGRCSVYENLYKDSELLSAKGLMESLPGLYAAVLIFLARSKRYFERAGAKRHANGVVDTYASKFLPHMEEIKKWENNIEVLARTAADEFQAMALMRAEEMGSAQQKAIEELQRTQQVAQQTFVDIESKVLQIRGNFENEERLAILKWLSEVAFERHHAFISSTRHPKTGNWLLERREFVEWKESTMSSMLWLHGNAGVGKTTLTSLVVDKFKKTLSSGNALVYFYCKYSEKERQDPESILRSIVKQLSIVDPDKPLPDSVVSLYRKQKQNGLNSGRLRLEESKTLIPELTKSFKQTIIIIDALDECDQGTKDEFLDALDSILQVSTGVIKIFATSRDENDLLLSLKDVPSVYLGLRENSRDIETFVTSEIERCISKRKLLRGSVDPQLKQFIIETLTKEAHGMFLWVDLQVKNVCREKIPSAVKSALNRLPKDMKATYAAIWKRICNQSDDSCLLAKKTLKWLLCAKSPLTPDQMIAAVSIKPMQWVGQPDFDGLTVTILLDVCQNLVVLDKELGVLRSAHFSVTEFLQDEFDLAEAHTEAAEVCLTLLCLENYVQPVYEGKSVLDNYSLGTYAIDNWMEHVRLSGHGSDTLMELQQDFLEHCPAYISWLKVAEERMGDNSLKPPGDAVQVTPLYVACQYQLWGIFEYLLNGNIDCNIGNCDGVTPLHLAAKHGNEVAVGMLLAKPGVEADPKDSDGLTPLSLAALQGKDVIVKLLLEMEGVDLNARHNRKSPLSFATVNGHHTVKIMLEKPRVYFEDTEASTPLSLAAREENEGVVKLVLENESVDVDAKGNFGQTPLYFAARSGHEKVVKLLLAKDDVDLNASDNMGHTPLYIAASHGHAMVVKLLLRRDGVDLNAKSNEGLTPLSAAAKEGHLSVVKLLLDKENIDLNPRASDGQTPLSLAAYYGHESVVQLLIGKDGVELNSKHNHGTSPLSFAAHCGHELVVKLFLQKEGVDINSRNSAGRTPLSAAVAGNHESTVKLLLEKNVNLSDQDNEGNTALSLAEKLGHEGIVRMLLEKECVDVNCS